MKKRYITGKQQGMKTMLPVSNRTESSIISNLAEKFVTSLRKRNKFFYAMQGE